MRAEGPQGFGCKEVDYVGPFQETPNLNTCGPRKNRGSSLEVPYNKAYSGLHHLGSPEHCSYWGIGRLW